MCFTLFLSHILKCKREGREGEGGKDGGRDGGRVGEEGGRERG